MLQTMGSQTLGMTERLNETYVTTSVVGFFKTSLGKFFLILLSE